MSAFTEAAAFAGTQTSFTYVRDRFATWYVTIGERQHGDDLQAAWDWFTAAEEAAAASGDSFR